MNNWPSRLAFLLCVLSPITPCAAAPPASLFDYDAHQPLDMHDKVVKKFACGVIHDITYASPSGGPVATYEIVPAGKGPFAAIVFGHWGNGTRAEFIPEAKLLACKGVISLLPDFRWDRAKPWYAPIDDFAHPDLDRKLRIGTVIEMRRGLDPLLGRSDVDAKRIGYVGHSFGAQWGAILSA